MKKFLAPLFLLASLAASVAIHATEAPTLSLLENQATRPTAEQVLAIVGFNPAAHPYEATIPNYDRRFVQGMQYFADLAKTIAFMEHMFPNAVWAPLGRDAVIFGDVLEAFYLAVGQPGRVARLNGSSASVRGISPANLVKFMEAAGLNLSPAGRPFVGIDRTSYGASSQGRELLAAAYKAYGQKHGDASVLIKRLNFFGLSATTTANHPHGLSAETAASYFRTAKIDNSGAVGSILQMPINNWTDTLAWHDTFGHLAVQANGRYEGTPGKLMPIEQRRAVLGEMVTIIRATSSPEFIASVAMEAKKLGYEFPIGEKLRLKEQIAKFEERERTRLEAERVLRQKGLDEFVINQSSELKKIIAGLEVLNEEELNPVEEQAAPASAPKPKKGYFTRNGKPISTWFEKTMKAHAELSNGAEHGVKVPKRYTLNLHFISEITQAYGKKTLSRKDYRRLLARALSASELEPEFFTYLTRIYKQEPGLEKTLQSKGEFFLTTFKTNKRPGTENTAEAYLKIRELVMGMPVECVSAFNEKPTEGVE